MKYQNEKKIFSELLSNAKQLEQFARNYSLSRCLDWAKEIQEKSADYLSRIEYQENLEIKRDEFYLRTAKILNHE